MSAFSIFGQRLPFICQYPRSLCATFISALLMYTILARFEVRFLCSLGENRQQFFSCICQRVTLTFFTFSKTEKEAAQREAHYAVHLHSFKVHNPSAHCVLLPLLSLIFICQCFSELWGSCESLFKLFLPSLLVLSLNLWLLSLSLLIQHTPPSHIHLLWCHSLFSTSLFAHLCSVSFHTHHTLFPLPCFLPLSSLVFTSSLFHLLVSCFCEAHTLADCSISSLCFLFFLCSSPCSASHLLHSYNFLPV